MYEKLFWKEEDFKIIPGTLFFIILKDSFIRSTNTHTHIHTQKHTNADQLNIKHLLDI